MPHAGCTGSPVALMHVADVKQMRLKVIAAMAAVPDCGFVERQVHLAIPAEIKLSPDVCEYKPVLHISFALEKGRTEDKLEEVCVAAAAVLYGYFAPFRVEEVQYTWDIDFADRFGCFPPKSMAVELPDSPEAFSQCDVRAVYTLDTVVLFHFVQGYGIKTVGDLFNEGPAEIEDIMSEHNYASEMIERTIEQIRKFFSENPVLGKWAPEKEPEDLTDR